MDRLGQQLAGIHPNHVWYREITCHIHWRDVVDYRLEVLIKAESEPPKMVGVISRINVKQIPLRILQNIAVSTNIYISFLHAYKQTLFSISICRRLIPRSRISFQPILDSIGLVCELNSQADSWPFCLPVSILLCNFKEFVLCFSKRCYSRSRTVQILSRCYMKSLPQKH